MEKTSALRAAEIRALHLLAGECRDLGDDPHVWRAHFAERLSTTIGTELLARWIRHGWGTGKWE